MACTITITSNITDTSGIIAVVGYNGSYYMTSTTLTVDVGTVLELYAAIPSGDTSEYGFFINGTRYTGNLYMSSGSNIYNYSYTVTDSCVITLSSNSATGSASGGKVVVENTGSSELPTSAGKHNILIDGTAYEITGGKTLINGTAYSISKGRTLIDGTGYDVGFSSLPTLVELFSDATVVEIAGRNESSTGSFNINSSNYETGLYYALSICNGFIGIYKFKDNVLSELFINVSDYAHIYKGTGLNRRYLYYSHDGLNKTSVNGATLVLLRFPSYDEETIDTVLGGFQVVIGSGRNASSSGNVSITESYCQASDIVIAAKAEDMCVYDGAECSGSVPTPIFKYANPNVQWSDGLIIRAVNGASIIGCKSTV